MAQDIPQTPKDIINTVYHAAVLSAITVGYSMIGKKFVKFDVGDPSKEYETVLKLIVPVSLAVVTKDWLVKQGLLPNDIINK
jgi:hypothetical protein